MVRYAGQDPLSMKYQRIEALETGYNIDALKRGGIVLVTNPTCSGPDLPSGTYFVETLTGVYDGRQVVFQVASSIINGSEYARYGDGNVWNDFAERGTGGGGGASDAIDVAYDPTSFPTPGTSIDVQAVLEELIEETFPGGIASRTFNVLNYGADPTGVANSRTAFNDAVTAADAVGGGIVYAPAGTYSIGPGASASLGGVLLKDKIMLMGDGPGRTIIKCADLGDNDMSGLVRTQSGQENDWIVVKDLTLDGAKADQTGWANTVPFFCGVTPNNRTLFDTDVWVINVEAKNGRNGTTGSGHDGGGGYGFDPHEMVDRIHFINCLAHDNEEDGFVFDGCANFTALNCKSWDNGRHGYNCVTESYDGQFIGCSAWDNASNNYTIQTDSYGIIIKGCLSLNAGQQGIRVRRGETITNTRCLISGNIIRGSGRNGIQITGCAQNVVDGNFFIDNGDEIDNTYFDVSLDEDDGDTGGATVGAASNIIKNNHAIATGTNKTKAAYRENSGASNPPNNNTYVWNTASGQVSSKYLNIASTSTILDHGYIITYDATAHGVLASNADNGTALRALADLVEARGGGEILLPAGTINASGTGTASQGVLYLPSKVSVRGRGKGVTILNCLDPVNNDVTGVIRTKSGGTNVGNSVMDLTITAANPSGTGGVTLLTVAGTSDTDFLAMNVELLVGRDAGSGFYSSRVTSSSVNARFVGCTANGGERDGFYEQGTKTSYIDCYSLSNGRHGFYASGATAPEFINCRAYNNATNQLLIENTVHAKVIGGDYDANSVNDDCVRIKGGATTSMHTIINGVTIRNAGRDGLSIAGSDYNKVMSCVFLDNGRQTNNTYHDVAIELNSAVTSSHNTISNCTMLSTAANKTAYGVHEVSAVGDSNHAVMNKYSGQVTGAVNLVGANSVRFDPAYFQFKDTLFALMDESDISKVAKFQLSGISTATTRTITLPDKSGTMAMLDDVVGFSGELAQEDEDTAPTAPSAGTTTLVGVPKGPLTFAGVINPDAKFTIFAPHLATGMEQTAWIRNNSTTVEHMGGTVTTSGSATARAVASGAGHLGAMKRVGYTCSGSPNANAGWRWGSNWMWRGNAADLGGFLLCITAGFTVNSTQRVVLGLHTVSTSPYGVSDNADPSATTNIFAIGKDAADTNLHVIHNDGSGTATKVSLGSNFTCDAGNVYEVWIHALPNGSAIDYAVRRLDSFYRAEGSITTDLIASGSFVGAHAFINSASNSVAYGIDIINIWGKAYLPHDNP